MSIDAMFEGGPADGVELCLIGNLPPYLLLMPNPVEDSPMTWLVCGAGFDDGWPEQQRYNLDLSRTHLLVADDLPSGEAVYVHAEGGAPVPARPR